jgi:hypothetical protein
VVNGPPKKIIAARRSPCSLLDVASLAQKIRDIIIVPSADRQMLSKLRVFVVDNQDMMALLVHFLQDMDVRNIFRPSMVSVVVLIMGAGSWMALC